MKTLKNLKIGNQELEKLKKLKSTSAFEKMEWAFLDFIQCTECLFFFESLCINNAKIYKCTDKPQLQSHNILHFSEDLFVKILKWDERTNFD